MVSKCYLKNHLHPEKMKVQSGKLTLESRQRILRTEQTESEDRRGSDPKRTNQSPDMCLDRRF